MAKSFLVSAEGIVFIPNIQYSWGKFLNEKELKRKVIKISD